MKKLILYILMFICTVSLAFAIPGSWYGYVSLDLATAADNAVVDAYISGSIVASTTVGAVQSDGYYLIHVEGSSGDSVSFRVFGNNVSESSQSWALGFQHPIFNLTAATTADGSACPIYTGFTSPTTYNSNLGCDGGYCVHDICRSATTSCGDSYCDTGETCTSCASDCGACASSGGGGGSSSSTTTIVEEVVEEVVDLDPVPVLEVVPEVVPQPAPQPVPQPAPSGEQITGDAVLPPPEEPIPLGFGVAFIILGALVTIYFVLFPPKRKKKKQLLPKKR